VKVRLFPLAVAALALVSVTACEKPAPQITVASSGRVINVDASRYCFKTCRDHKPADKSISVKGNTTVAFDVPKRVAKKGWIIQLGQQPLFVEPLKESHFTLTLPTIGQDQQVPVTITQAAPGAGGEPTGMWKMQFLVRQ
jgi:hypothetical protein